MSNFSRTEIVRELTSETSWVDIRKGMTWGDLSDMIDEALEVDVKSAKGDIKRVFAGRMQIARLRAGIANWGGPDFTTDGTNVVPVSLDAIRSLEVAAARQLMEIVTRHNPALEEGEDPKAEIAASVGTPSSSSAAAS